ncbi:MAG: phosphate ABC transporter permease PstA [Planctomycetota bacterium]
MAASDSMHTIRFWKRGEPWVWMTGAALSLVLLLMIGLVGVVVVNGMGMFWPSVVEEFRLADGRVLIGDVTAEEDSHEGRRLQVHVGNRDTLPADFVWIRESDITSRTIPEDVMVIERMEYGPYVGRLKGLEGIPNASEPWEALQQALVELEPTRREVKVLTQDIRSETQALEAVRLELKKMETGSHVEAAAVLRTREEDLRSSCKLIEDSLTEARAKLQAVSALCVDASGRESTLALGHIVRVIRPNAMDVSDKVAYYASRVRELLFDEPRECNTEGGLFPAIFGTVLMVVIMSVFSFPLGVLAGIYLREYARDGVLVRVVRIAVNNLAGIPSIVYGIFGLGFFVYGVGGVIDSTFFPERADAVFKTGGILWASLTLSLLTIPVVIVATEEALSSVPRGMKEGSLSLGATRFQTLLRVVLPMATPGILTGFILSMARAAGEVAPLMITGVVKLAPSLALDGSFPYIHLERKFMHLGFHIFDIAFQSPNIEAAKPMVYVTTFLLVALVLVMCSSAIWLRNRMKARFTLKDI